MVNTSDSKEIIIRIIVVTLLNMRREIVVRLLRQKSIKRKMPITRRYRFITSITSDITLVSKSNRLKNRIFTAGSIKLWLCVPIAKTEMSHRRNMKHGMKNISRIALKSKNKIKNLLYELSVHTRGFSSLLWIFWGNFSLIFVNRIKSVSDLTFKSRKRL